MIQYSDDVYYPLVKHQVYGVFEFLAAFGGLMGLIAGVSVFSIVELLYHIITISCACKSSSVAPEVRGIPRRKFLVNENGFFDRLKKYLRKIMELSSIHGFYYLINRTQSKAGNIFWTVWVLISVVFCTVLIIDTTSHAELNPIMFELDEKIWNEREVSSDF